MKRIRRPSSSDDSDTGSTSTSLSQHSKSQSRRSKGKASEVFRTDLITAMKLHDSYQLNTEDYYVLADPWRQEWEKGVQVPVSPHSVPQPVVCPMAEKPSAVMFSRPKKMIRSSGVEPAVLGYVGIRTLAEGVCRYDLDEEDVAWLHYANKELSQMGMQTVDELTMEKVMEEFERSCYDRLSHAMETEEGLGIEFDEDVVCDVCQSPDGEDGNEMVFCDKCNICVHQACYGIMKVPEGSWLCRICALGILPRCQLCPKKGGAMKPTRSGTKWVHVSCALWIPEVSIGNPEKMEPITNISHIPSNRWALSCCLCKDRSGACIQCSAKSCRTAFHITCGQRAGLKMSTILTEADEVKFKSFCPQHSGLKTSKEEEDGEKEEIGEETSRRGGRKGRDPNSNPRPTPDLPHAEGIRLSERKQRLQQLEDEFYRFVSMGDVAKRLGLPGETVDFVYQYWKLKRRANLNQPLITPKREEEESLARREQEVLLRRLRLFTHLRQDLERVRNLTYMVTRREKIKRSVCRVQEQIFQQHIKLLEHDRFTGLSKTRRLSEALFYFRAPPSVPYSSPRALKGHSALNTPPPPSTATQAPLSSAQAPPNPGLKLEETQRAGGTSRSSQAESPPKPPKTNGILPAKTLRANGVLPSQLPRTNGVVPGRLPKETDGSPDLAPAANTRRITRGEATRAATAKPADSREKQSTSNTIVTTETCMQIGDLGLPHALPNLIPTLRLTPVTIPPHTQIYNMEDRRRRPRDPSPVRSKLRTGLRVSQEQQQQQKPVENADATETVTQTKATPSAVTVETKYNGVLRRSSSSQDCSASGNLKDWGSFRIPKKSERTTRGQQGGVTVGQVEPEPQVPHPEPPPCPRRTSDRTSVATHAAPPTLRTRLRVGSENNAKGAESGQSDQDAQGKRCQTQRLRSHDIMARRYTSDIIRRGVLAS
ncbi:protein Jade-1 isoform X2 [Clupea harengus]|nr:protein Jade-1 isoform X2 [Clupea harengus]XP_042562385.1 protein Jade-1 isoform X2 [Clupea harengus]XP_042562386.1 protein Jade-1 isoform X2 [Clupea harengus]XP_042562387.1 protein Jade-1 isoform X2 [Clupea harengus]XP_042562388.1 protein Jade-1 isoform X2 [Clupea harengus]